MTRAPTTPTSARDAARTKARRIDLTRWDTSDPSELAAQFGDMAVTHGLPTRLRDEYEGAFYATVCDRL